MSTLGALRKAPSLRLGMIIGTAFAPHPEQPRLLMCSRSTSPILGQGLHLTLDHTMTVEEKGVAQHR